MKNDITHSNIYIKEENRKSRIIRIKDFNPYIYVLKIFFTDFLVF